MIRNGKFVLRALTLRVLRKILLGDIVQRVIYTNGGFPDAQLVGKPSQIGDFSVVDYGGDLTIGTNVKMGYGVVIVSASTITGSKCCGLIREPITIEDNVEIGSNATILPGVRIGHDATIGAGAVVNEDVPANSIVVGVPAKITKWKKEI